MISLLSYLGHKYPLLNGFGLLANLPPVKAVVDRWAPPEIRARLRNGTHVLALKADFVSRAALLFGDLDPKLTLIAKRVLRKGDHVLDVGANLGVFSLYASQFVGPRGRVDAFEPQRELVGLMKRSLAENEIHNVCVHPVALGEERATGSMFVPPSNRGAGSLTWAPAGSSETSVDVRRADDYIKAAGIGPIRLMKMDVEGFESQVIGGMSHFLTNQPPDAIVMEVHPRSSGDQRNAVDQLESHGYDCRDILPSAFQLKFGECGRTGNRRGVHDILAVVKGAVGRELLGSLQG